jgi:hypothetical protein
MKQIQNLRPYLPEILLIAGGFVLRIAFALLPREMHFILLEDDAWMVTNIARHWALGHGITADGVHPTNGFHPLYPLTLGALPYLVRPGDLDFGFRANMLMCAVLNTLALLPLYGLLRTVSQRVVALAGLALIAFNPFFIRVSVNAMETSLALLLLLLLWWAMLAHEPGRGEALRGVFLGMLAGLAILARLDTMIAAGMIGLVLLWREVMQRRCLPLVSTAYATTIGIIMVPYFARNLFVFGHLTPSSGRALSYMHSYRESFALSSGLQLAAYQPAVDLTWAPPLLLLLALVLLAWLVWGLAPAQRSRLLPVLLYAPAITFYYAYIQQQGRPRYYIGVGIVVVLLLCAWLHQRFSASSALSGALSGVLQRYTAPLLTVVTTAVILLNTSTFVTHVSTLMHAPYLAQPAMYQAARWIAHNLPKDAWLAAQNSGVFQYYSERVVLNIDGKLNDKIIPVLEQRELDIYLRNQQVSYIVDLPGVADYIEFYSSNLSEAPPHHEMSLLDKMSIYMLMIGAKVGVNEPVHLDERIPTRIIRPFGEVATIVKEFPLPNDPSQAVTIYRLREDFGSR